MTNKVLNITLTDVEIEQLRSIARTRGISIAALIRTRLRFSPMELMSQGQWANWSTDPLLDGVSFGDQWSASDE